ncbi:MAG: glycosyltransferase family 39 protein [Planctomycetota bacterium]|nr:glycosyltransferase family 39 protein [Planctomycetota bacterium]
MVSKLNRFHSIWPIILVALSLRVVAALYWEAQIEEGQNFRFGDSEGYWQLAIRIAEGESYEYNSSYAKVFRTPGYPLFLSGFILAGVQSALAVRLVGAVLGAISVGLIYAISRTLFRDRVAWFAGWIACFYPGAVAISILVLAEMLFVPLMLLQFLSAILAFQSPCPNRRRIHGLVSGFCFGLACLTRPSWILFLPFSLLLGLLFYPERKKQLVLAGATLLMTLLVMAPWWVRNYSVTGKFVLTSLQTGASLYDGLNPVADGSSDMRFAPRMKSEYLKRWKAEGGANYEFEYAFNQFLTREAIQWALQNRVRTLELMAIKFRRIWTPLPNSREMGSPLIRYLVGLYFLPLIGMALIGAWEQRKQFLPVWICLLPAIYFTGLHMVFVGSIRYRQPPMMTLLIFAAVMLAKGFPGKNHSEGEV